MHSITPPGVALAVRGLTRTYGSGDQAVAALRGIDLTLSSGIATAVPRLGLLAGATRGQQQK